MKKFMEEFKAFALRGNVVDLAIGVLIGGAFGALVGALTDDFITPILNCIGGGADLGWSIHLVGDQYLLVGHFVSAIINFIIYAFVIFMIMKSMNKLATLGKKEEEAAPEPEPAPDPNVVLLTEIRDLLKNK
ncbi:MAG: large conductance mechanosensitive channel protein MscL [Firmicutes bacterium]|nr:large conductance mechanosensitive channel protein MscL [Bacillota bacterium]